MALLDEEKFRKIYVTDSATELAPDQIIHCLDEARDELATICGESVVTEVEDSSSDDDRKVLRFQRAQGKLAYRELLLIMSSRFRSGGILTQERDANSSATDSYEKFSEVEKRRAALYDEAMRAIAVYIPQDTGNDGAGSIEFHHPVIGSSCCNG